MESAMTTNPITKIAELFHRRSLILQRKADLAAGLDRLEPIYPCEAYDLVDAQIDRLHDLIIELDEQIAAAPIEEDTDRAIIATVARWRDNENDCGLSAAIAARLAVRLGPIAIVADGTR
jgi:hypothetical protein